MYILCANINIMLFNIMIRFYCIFYNRLCSAEQLFCVAHFFMNTKYETPAKDLKRSFGLSRSKTRQLRAHYHACNYDPSKRRRDIKRLCLKKSNFAKQSFGLIIGEAIFRGRRSRVRLLYVTKDFHSSLYPLYLFCLYSTA